MRKKPLFPFQDIKAILAAVSFLVGFYLGVTTLYFGWPYALSTLVTYWYFILVLSVSFGYQIGREIKPLF